MNRQARFSLVGKGFLTAAAVMLFMGAQHAQTDAVAFGQAPHESAERIQMYDAQPVRIVQTGPAPKSIDYVQARSEQRWVF